MAIPFRGKEKPYQCYTHSDQISKSSLTLKDDMTPDELAKVYREIREAAFPQTFLGRVFKGLSVSRFGVIKGVYGKP